MESNIVVSICMITYNHANYIEAAIKSIVEQETNFDYQLVIGDDCSKDGTRTICEQYANQYPQKIKLLPSDKNWGMMPNFIRTLQACSGKYIAICEGDDYWTNPHKLQKQIDFLEQHQDFSLCCHNAYILKKESQTDFSKGRLANDAESHEILIEEIMSSDIRLFHTATLCFRNDKNLIPDWFVNCINGDFPLMCLVGAKGKIWYEKDHDAIYRIHETGVTNRPFSKEYLQKLENMFLLIDKGLGGKFKKSLLQGYQGREFHYLLSNFRNEPSFFKRIAIWIKMFYIHRSNYSMTKRDLLYLLRTSFSSPLATKN